MNAQLVLHFLEALGRLSVQAAVLVLLVLMAQRIFQRWLTPRWRCSLWLLVVGRLLLPASLPSRISIFNLVPITPKEHIAQTARIVPAAPEQPDRLTAFKAEVSLPRPVATLDDMRERVPAAAPVATSPVIPVTQTVSVNRAPHHRTVFSWPLLLISVWLVGVVALATRILVTSVMFARRFRGLLEVSNPDVLALLEDCRGRMQVRNRLRLVEGANVPSPALHGLVRPRLLLPKGFTQSFSLEELHFVFLHELAHVKRRDVLMNWLVALLQIVHWFNPLLWFGFMRWRADRELACDALALEKAGEGRNREYGRTILRLLESLTDRVAAPGLVGILEDKRQLQQRIGMIASFVPGRKWPLLAVLLLATLGVICLTDAQAPRTKSAQGAAKTFPVDDPTKKASEPREVRRGTDPLPTANGTNVPAQALTLIVEEAETGKPIAGAEIFAPVGDWRKPQPERLTDAQGRYIVQVPLPPAEARRRMSNLNISVRHRDHAAHAVAWTSSGGDVYAILPAEVTVKLAKGIPIGGVVQDEAAKPLAGVKVLLDGSAYRGFTMGTSEQRNHDYAELHLIDTAHPAAVTDAEGRWTFAHFPSELDTVEVTLVRPDESRQSFSTTENQSLNARPLVAMRSLKEQTAVLSMRSGLTVRGQVVDEHGRPVAGALVKEGYGHGNIQRVSEFITGPDGRFNRLNRAPRQWIYTATSAGRATVSIVAQVQEGMGEVKIVLPPAKPMRLRIIDEEGKPIPAADIRLDSYRNEAQILDWEAKSDDAGRATWTNAPTAPVTFYASAGGPIRKFTARASETEQEIVIRKNPLSVAKAHIKAFDSATRAPVKMESVAANMNGDFKPTVLAKPDAAEYVAEIKMSDVRVGMYPSYTLTIAAAGYEPFTTKQFDIDTGDQDIEVPLVRAFVPENLHVLLPDGGPAVGARVWVRPNENAGALFVNSPNRYYGDRWEKAQVASDGKVKLPLAPSNAPIVVAHTNGFLKTSLAAIRQTNELKLQPWSRIDGRVLVGGKPKSELQLTLSSLQGSFHLIYNTMSGADGSFTFTNVPAGEYTIYRRYNHRIGTITPSHQMPITVKTGEILKLDYSLTGRMAIGQALPDPPEAAVDWLNDTHVLSVKAKTERWGVNREDYATFEAFNAANTASFSSVARLESERQARNYELVFERDGSFQIDDVPPGTYELRIQITKPNERNNFRPAGSEGELGSLKREVIVPVGNGAFDLGTVVVPMKVLDLAPKGAPVTLNAQTLDGKDLNLAEFRGKHVLVAFWAAWSQRSSEQLAQLSKLKTELGFEDRLAFLSLNLDDDAPGVRKSNESLGKGWKSARLEGRARTDVTAAFNVETLPAIFLLDPNGRIVGRELEGDRLRTAIERALKKK